MTRISLFLVTVLVIAACGGSLEPFERGSVAAAAQVQPHADQACVTDLVPNDFAAHDLDHITSGAQDQTTLFDGTGSGVAIADLNGDGLLDIVLTNLSGPSTVHWNRGGLSFERADLITGRFRQPALIDLDADDDLDLVLTTGVGKPAVVINEGGERFGDRPGPFDDVAYSIAWSDVDGDGDIDVATGSYNAELTAQRDISSVLGGDSGITFYENRNGSYTGERLADIAQALVVRFNDVDADGMVDLQAGNDLATPDALWVRRNGLWVVSAPFPRTTFSTMSLDAADIDNDGRLELYATDMHPMDDEPETVAAWEPVMEDMAAMPMVDEVQAMENVLLDPEGTEFVSRATDLGIPFTGWSWSGVFGDLDQDGWVDLYVVNGMESPAMFPNLPGGALVEPNQAFRNVEGERFEPMPDWGLADTAGGRGMAMADLDGDGDLDIVVNNLNAPARLFENQICSGSAVTVDLTWADTDNLDALGAMVEARLDDGRTLVRDIEPVRGYLSAGPPIAHFGVGDAELVSLRVRWPDGETSVVETVPSGSHVTVTR